MMVKIVCASVLLLLAVAGGAAFMMGGGVEGRGANGCEGLADGKLPGRFNVGLATVAAAEMAIREARRETWRGERTQTREAAISFNESRLSVVQGAKTLLRRAASEAIADCFTK